MFVIPPLSPGHQEKPNILCFHPQASSLMASAGFDCRLLIWDLEQRKIALRMDPLPQPVRLRETESLKLVYMRAIYMF